MRPCSSSSPTILGGVISWWAPLAIPAAVLTASAFAAPLTAFAATQETDFRFPVIMRLGVIPLFLFSGTFFPISQLPGWLQPFCWLSPLWHGVAAVPRRDDGDDRPARGRRERGDPRDRARQRVLGHPHLHQEARDMTAAGTARLQARAERRVARAARRQPRAER